MDVTREAFFDLLPELEEAIEKALFISIDGEFTGIDNGSVFTKNTPYDPPFEVYNRQLQKALDFLLIQFGMCIFYYDDNTQKYTHQAYNFYVFPQSNSQYEPDPIFKCQSSSLAFLAFEGFDFNKLFREGIPYLNEDEEQRKRKALEEKWKALKKPQNKVSSDVPVPKEKEEYLTDVRNQVGKFLNEEDESEYLTLNPSNPFVRRLVYQEIEKEFGESVCLRTDYDKKDNSSKKDKGIFVFRGTDKEKLQLFDEETEKREWRELETSIGFSHVIKLLSKSRKLIVGHNMLLDVCHTVNRFVCSIPDNYDLFKNLLHRTFPRYIDHFGGPRLAEYRTVRFIYIYLMLNYNLRITHSVHRMIDTKTMTSLPPFQKYFQSTVLQSVLETLSSDPFHIPECDVQVSGRGYSTLKAKEHEAGYDAYVTGLCYLALCDFLEKDGQNGVQADEIANEFMNKIYVWVLDAPYIHIGEEDPKPSRQHVFHLEYPHEWKRHNVARLFKSVGPVNVSFLSEKRAYVALINKQNASRVTNIEGGIVTRYDVYHSVQSRRDLKLEDESTSKKEQAGKKSGKSNEKQSSMLAETSAEMKTNSKSKKRGARNKNKNDDSDSTSGAFAKQRGNSEGLLQGGSDEDASDPSLIKPPPPKIRKEFEVDDDWS